MKIQMRLMPDYFCWPLWGDETDGTNIDPSTLPISEALVERLLVWSDTFDNTLDMDDPGNGTGFDSPEDKQKFINDGIYLARDLQNELGKEYEIQYYHLKYGLMTVEDMEYKQLL